MNQNFFTDIHIQKVLKKSKKTTHHYNNKFGTFLIYPLFKDFTIIYACQPLNKKSTQFIKKLARRHNSIYTVIETLNPVQEFKHKSFKEFIPRATRQISLSQPLEEIYKQMHPKGRYNAKLAQKKALTVSKDLTAKQFYQLLQNTSVRDNFSINSKDYYTQLFKLIPNHQLHKYAVYLDKQLIAAAIVIDHKDTAYYLYGASDHKHRQLMAPYLIQHQAIKDAKQRKLKIYDFLGISPYSPHPLDKVSEFKRKFGGQIVHYQQNQIIIHKPILFGLLKIRKFLKNLKN